MKKKDIIQLVKEAVKETTFYGNRHQRSSISGLPGVMEDEDLKEITDPGGQGIYPKKEEPGDMFQQKEVEGLMPNAMASRNDKGLKDKLAKHAEWTEQSRFNNTFVHFQYHETEGLEDKYFIYQSQFYNGNYDDFRNPRFTELIIKKNRDTEKEEKLGTYIVDTDAYIKDIQTLRSRGVLGDRVSEGIKADDFKNNPKLQPGKTVKYAGTSRKIEKNDGFILTLDNGEKVNLSQFNKRGAIKEASNNLYYNAIEAKAKKMGMTANDYMKDLLADKTDAEVAQMGFQDIAKLAGINLEEADTKTYVGVDSVTAIKKDPRYGTLSGDTKMDIEKKLKTGGSVELEEEPNEISYDDAKKKGLKSPDKADISKDKDISDYELKRGMAVQKAIDDQEKNEAFTNDIGKDDYMDDEGRMAKSQLYKAGKYAMKLHDMLDDMEQLPAWVQAKLTKASDYMSVVYHYLDYEFARRDSNLMEHVDKHRKRGMLMEGAMKRFFEMFDDGMTDEEIVQSYAKKGITVPETFISKARKTYEGMKKMKLELEMGEKEFRNSSSKMVNNTEEGMESVEEKKLSSRLNK